MADITMCSGKNCSMKNRCFRYTATADKYRQSYFATPPINNGKCHYFWDNPQMTSKEIKENEFLTQSGVKSYIKKVKNFLHQKGFYDE